MLTHDRLVELISDCNAKWSCPDFEVKECTHNHYCDKCAESLATEYENDIRSDERKRFAFWLINRIHRDSLQRVLSETKNFDIMGIDNILSIYEKEQKGEQK